MDEKRIQEDEYELQHFDFSSSEFIDHLKQTTFYSISSTLQNYQDMVLSLGCPTVDAEELQNGLEQVNKKWCDVADMHIKGLEPSIRKFFKIPKNVLLPDDESQIEQYSEDDVVHIEQEISVLEKEYMKEKMFAYLCQKELSILEKLKPIQEKIQNVIQKTEKTRNVIAELEKCNELLNTYEEMTKKFPELQSVHEEMTQQIPDLKQNEDKFKSQFQKITITE